MSKQYRASTTPWWKNKKLILRIVVSAVLGVIVFIASAYIFHWDWTGLNGYNNVLTTTEITASPQKITKTIAYQPGKTLWDWLQLLIIPAVLAAGGYVFNLTVSRNDQKSVQLRDQTERDITSDNQREAALQGYMDKMSELLLHESLHKSKPEDEERNVARTRTLTALRRLDAERKVIVLRFLYESKLLKSKIAEPVPDTVEKSIIDLSGADLHTIDLSGVFLDGIDLSGADLSGASLRGTHLVRSNLDSANLSGADLRGAHLDRSNLDSANLSGADLSGIDLGLGDPKRGKVISPGPGRPTSLEKADLRGANLRGAGLRCLHLGKANLRGANLSGADLSSVDLSNADLSNADLSNADLRWADLSGANLSNADLSNADLREVSGTQEQLTTARNYTQEQYNRIRLQLERFGK